MGVAALIASYEAHRAQTTTAAAEMMRWRRDLDADPPGTARRTIKQLRGTSKETLLRLAGKSPPWVRDVLLHYAERAQSKPATPLSQQQQKIEEEALDAVLKLMPKGVAKAVADDLDRYLGRASLMHSSGAGL